MGKKKSAASTKTAAKAAKKAKATQKVERKETKKATKGKSKHEAASDDDSDNDLEAILDKMQKEWEQAHTVTEEVADGPPSRRANATLTPCPNGNHLWCIGGEFFSEDGKAYFYQDVFRYSPEKDEWRKFVSPTCPGPRSAHAVATSPVGGGKIFLFGGEFSSLHQNTFHHYRDFWCFDIPTHSWDRIETKIRPSARSGHRMAMWKHFVVLFGGFYDPGMITRYHDDLWFFDTQEYRWFQAEFKPNENRPSPRSGFSFLPTADGIVLHGGYCKEYAKGKRPVGVMLEDTWFLHISITPQPSSSSSTSGSTSSSKSKSSSGNPLTLKWEKRKRGTYAPPLRSGCTMALWPTGKAGPTGILFGGVTDEDASEETLDSVFWNDLYGYQMNGKGKWVSMNLKLPKKKVAKKKKKAKAPAVAVPASRRKEEENDSADDIEEFGDDEDEDDMESKRSRGGPKHTPTTNQALMARVGGTNAPETETTELAPDDPILTTPLPRYNAMLAVQRNTLYIYGGIYERGSREYTLDDFYSLQLDKMEKYVCLKETALVFDEAAEVSSSSSSGSEGEDTNGEGEEDDGETTVIGEDIEEEQMRQKLKTHDEEDEGNEDEETHAAVVEFQDLVLEEAEIEEAQEEDELRTKAVAFMGVAKDAVARSPEDVLSTPLPGETLAMFYARSREYWTEKAHEGNEGRGKELRRVGFSLAEERYAAYKPLLEEVEKILAEAGLDEEEMRKGAAAGPPAGGNAGSRNRR